jgi:hypothetical protein
MKCLFIKFFHFVRCQDREKQTERRYKAKEGLWLNLKNYNTSHMFPLRGPSSDVQRHVFQRKSNYVSEERVASIFRVEEYAKTIKQHQSRWKLVSCLTYFSTLKLEVICSSETSVDFQRTTRCCIPEERALHSHRFKNLKSYKRLLVYT